MLDILIIFWTGGNLLEDTTRSKFELNEFYSIVKKFQIRKHFKPIIVSVIRYNYRVAAVFLFASCFLIIENSCFLTFSYTRKGKIIFVWCPRNLLDWDWTLWRIVRVDAPFVQVVIWHVSHTKVARVFVRLWSTDTRCWILNRISISVSKICRICKCEVVESILYLEYSEVK